MEAFAMESQTASAEQPKATRMLRMPEVLDKTGMSKSFVESKVRDGTFPQPVKLGGRATAFIEEEVDQWLQQAIEASRVKEQELNEYRKFCQSMTG